MLQVLSAACPQVRTASLALTCAALWMALFAAKALLGFSLRGIAQHFLQRHPKA